MKGDVIGRACGSRWEVRVRHGIVDQPRAEVHAGGAVSCRTLPAREPRPPVVSLDAKRGRRGWPKACAIGRSTSGSCSARSRRRWTALSRSRLSDHIEQGPAEQPNRHRSREDRLQNLLPCDLVQTREAPASQVAALPVESLEGDCGIDPPPRTMAASSGPLSPCAPFFERLSRKVPFLTFRPPIGHFRPDAGLFGCRPMRFCTHSASQRPGPALRTLPGIDEPTQHERWKRPLVAWFRSPRYEERVNSGPYRYFGIGRTIMAFSPRVTLPFLPLMRYSILSCFTMPEAGSPPKLSL